MNPIALKKVLYELPGTDAVTVRTEGRLDIYEASGGSKMAVVIVSGYPDPGFERIVGCKFKDMASSVSWAKLIAASGMAAITYTNEEPVADLNEVLDHVSSKYERVGLWSSSGNSPLALSVVARAARAVFLYPYTVDVPEAAKKFGFATPDTGSLTSDVPLLFVRAGKDEMPGLNETFDRFVVKALAENLPVTVINHPHAPHAFDLLDESAMTREVIRRVLEFLN